jgi:hypothetical protein
MRMLTKMGSLSVMGLGLLALACCTATDQTKIETAAATPAGQLFCAMQVGLTPIVAKIVTDQGTKAGPEGAASAVVVTGATSAWVQGVCDAAAKATGASAAIPVSPPVVGLATVPTVAVPPSAASK